MTIIKEKRGRRERGDMRRQANGGSGKCERGIHAREKMEGKRGTGRNGGETNSVRGSGDESQQGVEV